MKLISWNINGLRSIAKKGFVPFVENQNPDILCVQEIKIDRETLADQPELLPGYEMEQSCAEKKGYSGVATWLSPDAKERVREVTYGIDQPVFDSEGRFLITRFNKFTLYNIYFPSGTTGETRQSFKYDFLEEFTTHIKSLSTRERNRIIICGDFNICHKEIDIHHPKTAEQRQLSGFLPQERAWMDTFTELGFVDAFRQKHGPEKKAYTWWSFRAGSRTKNLGWRIDYFFVSKKLSKSIVRAEILSEITGSDHCPLVLEMDL